MKRIYLHVTDELEGGPELGGIIAEMLVDRLLVRLISEPFDIPMADVVFVLR